jgi:hypothetical protein
MLARLEREGDLWAEMPGLSQRLPVGGDGAAAA